MLMLSRAAGDKIYLETEQGTVTIVVVEISRKYVRIGIDAPRSMNIHRAELSDMQNSGTPSDVP